MWWWWWWCDVVVMVMLWWWDDVGCIRAATACNCTVTLSRRRVANSIFLAGNSPGSRSGRARPFRCTVQFRASFRKLQGCFRSLSFGCDYPWGSPRELKSRVLPEAPARFRLARVVIGAGSWRCSPTPESALHRMQVEFADNESDFLAAFIGAAAGNVRLW